MSRRARSVVPAAFHNSTRVPIAALFENLEDGARVTDFVEWFPGVGLEQIRSVLEHAARSALARA